MGTISHCAALRGLFIVFFVLFHSSYGILSCSIVLRGMYVITVALNNFFLLYHLVLTFKINCKEDNLPLYVLWRIVPKWLTLGAPQYSTCWQIWFFWPSLLRTVHRRKLRYDLEVSQHSRCEDERWPQRMMKEMKEERAASEGRQSG